MSLKLETARIPIVLTGKEWAALCVRFVLGESLSEESDAIYEVAKLKIMQQVYHGAKALGPEPEPAPQRRLVKALTTIALALALVLRRPMHLRSRRYHRRLLAVW